jgi:hypothetical protein
MIKKTLLALSVVAFACTGALAQQGGIKRTPLQKVEFPDGFSTVTGIAEIPRAAARDVIPIPASRSGMSWKAKAT